MTPCSGGGERGEPVPSYRGLLSGWCRPSTASGRGHPPGPGRPGAPPASGSCCGPPASAEDNARSISSTRGRRSVQSRPVASAWFSASTAATSSWSRLRICPDQLLPVVGCALGQQVPAVDEVGQGGPQWRPRQGPLARGLGGQDRRQYPSADVAGSVAGDVGGSADVWLRSVRSWDGSPIRSRRRHRNR
jgi:hypothetical protein